MVAVVIAAASAVTIVVQAVALATAVDRSLLQHVPLHAVRVDLLVVVVAFVIRAVLALAGERFAHHAADAVVSTLQARLVRHILDLGPSWLAGERPGELSTTATRGLRSLHDYFSRYLPQAATAAVVPVVLLAWVASQDWLSLVVVLALVIAMPITMIYFGREATKRTARQWRRLGSLAGRFLQLIEGLATLRAFNRDAYGRREVEASSEAVREATMRTLRVAFLSALSMDLIAGFGVGFVAMVLGLRLLWGELSLTTAMSVLLVAPEIFVPLRRAGAEFHASTEGQAALTRIVAVLDTEPSHAPARRTAAVPHTSPTPPAAPSGQADLSIAHLTVHYEHRSAPAISDFSLHVTEAQRVALVGPSGAGKSTVLSALLGFAVPVAGTMALGGRDSTEWDTASWRAQFAWVPQRPYLFTTSLADNLRLGARSADEAALEQVVEAVGLRHLVDYLPDGLDTAVGQDGLTLSSGERQRVALARALLSPAPILLLDEPTAFLDPATAADIATNIERWLQGRTVIVSAHAPLLLADFDAVHEIRTPAAVR
jgi:thiol reductant ABC exporter CydD subunit